jgi:hypothetical protein
MLVAVVLALITFTIFRWITAPTGCATKVVVDPPEIRSPSQTIPRFGMVSLAVVFTSGRASAP